MAALSRVLPSDVHHRLLPSDCRNPLSLGRSFGASKLCKPHEFRVLSTPSGVVWLARTVLVSRPLCVCVCALFLHDGDHTLSVATRTNRARTNRRTYRRSPAITGDRQRREAGYVMESLDKTRLERAECVCVCACVCVRERTCVSEELG